MSAFLARRWFLLLILAGTLCVWLWPDQLLWTAALDPAVIAALALFLSAGTLESRSLLRSLVRPLPAFWSLAISYLLLPALALAASRLLPLADLRIGLIVIASVPCTLTSAVIWTRLAGGSEGTALLVVLLTNLTSWLFTTAWLFLGTGSGGGGLDAGRMMTTLALVLVLPVGVGQALRAVGPLARAADRFKKPLGVTARLLTVVVMLKAAVEVRVRLEGQAVPAGVWLVLLTAALCLGTHLAALAGGLWGAKALGFARPDGVAAALAGSQKTLPIALVLFDAYYQAYPLAVLPVVFFHVGQLVADTFIAERLAGRRPPEAERPPAEEWAAEAVV